MILIIGVISAKSHRRKEPPATGAHKRTLEQWQSQEFVSLTNDISISELVAAFGFQARASLDREEKAALIEAAADFIRAFHTGTFEDYTRFRMPVKIFRFTPGVSNAMRNGNQIPEATIVNEPMDAFKTYYTTNGGPGMYSNLWIGISVSNCEIEVERSMSSSNDLLYSLQNSSLMFKFDSIANVKTIGEAIRHPTEKDGVSRYLRSQLTTNASNLLFSVNTARSNYWEDLQWAVLSNFNAIIQTGPIYTTERFDGVKLSPATSNLLAQNPVGDDLVKLNRLLLVDVYPRALRASTWVDNAGLSGNGPIVYLSPSRKQVLNRDGFVDVATISILPKLRDNFAPSKVYLRLYWSPSDKKWLPQQMVMANGRSNRGPFLLF